jgi:hypothetical protein
MLVGELSRHLGGSIGPLIMRVILIIFHLFPQDLLLTLDISQPILLRLDAHALGGLGSILSIWYIVKDAGETGLALVAGMLSPKFLGVRLGLSEGILAEDFKVTFVIGLELIEIGMFMNA